MATIAEILEDEGQQIVDDLIKKYDQLGMRASGNWAKKLHYEVIEKPTGAILQIKGTRYTEQLVYGRKPGKFPPLDAIKDWIREKRIPLTNGMTIGSLAYLIARKIGENGTRYFQQGGTDLISSVINEQRFDKIIDDLSEEYVLNLTTFVVDSYKKER